MRMAINICKDELDQPRITSLMLGVVIISLEAQCLFTVMPILFLSVVSIVEGVTGFILVGSVFNWFRHSGGFQRFQCYFNKVAALVIFLAAVLTLSIPNRGYYYYYSYLGYEGMHVVAGVAAILFYAPLHYWIGWRAGKAGPVPCGMKKWRVELSIFWNKKAGQTMGSLEQGQSEKIQQNVDSQGNNGEGKKKRWDVEMEITWTRIMMPPNDGLGSTTGDGEVSVNRVDAETAQPTINGNEQRGVHVSEKYADEEGETFKGKDVPHGDAGNDDFVTVEAELSVERGKM